MDVDLLGTWQSCNPRRLKRLGHQDTPGDRLGSTGNSNAGAADPGRAYPHRNRIQGGGTVACLGVDYCPSADGASEPSRNLADHHCRRRTGKVVEAPRKSQRRSKAVAALHLQHTGFLGNSYTEVAALRRTVPQASTDNPERIRTPGHIPLHRPEAGLLSNQRRLPQINLL